MAKKRTKLAAHRPPDYDGAAVRRQAEAYAEKSNLDAFINDRISTTHDDEGLAPTKNGELIRINRWGSHYGQKWAQYRFQIVGTVLQIFAEPTTIEQARQFVPGFIPFEVVDLVKLIQITRIRIFHESRTAYLDIAYDCNGFPSTSLMNVRDMRSNWSKFEEQIKPLRKGLSLIGLIGSTSGGRPSDTGFVNNGNASAFLEFLVDKAKSIAHGAVPTLHETITACDGKYGITQHTSERTVQRYLQRYLAKTYRDDVLPLIRSHLNQKRP